MIDWTKPIEYLDGSPATFLRFHHEGYAVVTPRGEPNTHGGNYYRDDGTHISSRYPSIRNVDPIVTAIRTLAEAGYSVTPTQKQRNAVADILRQFGFILDAQTTRNGDQDTRVLAVAHLLKGDIDVS